MWKRAGGGKGRVWNGGEEARGEVWKRRGRRQGEGVDRGEEARGTFCTNKVSKHNQIRLKKVHGQ